MKNKKNRIFTIFVYIILIPLLVIIGLSILNDFNQIGKGYIPANTNPVGFLILIPVLILLLHEKNKRIFLILALLVITVLFYFFSYD